MASDERLMENGILGSVHIDDARNGDFAGYLKCKDIECAILMRGTNQLLLVSKI